MRVNKSVNVKLEDEELRRLNDGEPLRIPLEENQYLQLHPPKEGASDE